MPAIRDIYGWILPKQHFNVNPRKKWISIMKLKLSRLSVKIIKHAHNKTTVNAKRHSQISLAKLRARSAIDIPDQAAMNFRARRT